MGRAQANCQTGTKT